MTAAEYYKLTDGLENYKQIKAGELKKGDVILTNDGNTTLVEEIVKESKAFITILVRGLDSVGSTTITVERKFKKDRALTLLVKNNPISGN